MRAEVLKGHLDTLLLATVAAEPAHGYLIVERLRQRTGGALAVGEGTVYPALYRLEAAGLLTSRWSHESGRKRRIYSLSARGLTALQAGRIEWQRLSQVMEAVLS
jgi:DNA-binding PadR family transcriptional regulator